MVYHLDEVTGALVVSNRLVVSSKDFPGQCKQDYANILGIDQFYLAVDCYLKFFVKSVRLLVVDGLPFFCGIFCSVVLHFVPIGAVFV